MVSYGQLLSGATSRPTTTGVVDWLDIVTLLLLAFHAAFMLTELVLVWLPALAQKAPTQKPLDELYADCAAA